MRISCLCDFSQLKVLSQTPPLCSSSSFIEMLKVNLIIVFFFFGIKLSYVCIFNFLHLLFFVHFLIVFKSLNFLYLNPRPQTDLSPFPWAHSLPSFTITPHFYSHPNRIKPSLNLPPNIFLFSSSIISLVFLLPQSPTWWVSHILGPDEQITITGGIFCN
jgi:hypothetical protein